MKPTSKLWACLLLAVCIAIVFPVTGSAMKLSGDASENNYIRIWVMNNTGVDLWYSFYIGQNDEEGSYRTIGALGHQQRLALEEKVNYIAWKNHDSQEFNIYYGKYKMHTITNGAFLKSFYVDPTDDFRNQGWTVSGGQGNMKAQCDLNFLRYMNYSTAGGTGIVFTFDVFHRDRAEGGRYYTDLIISVNYYNPAYDNDWTGKSEDSEEFIIDSKRGDSPSNRNTNSNTGGVF